MKKDKLKKVLSIVLSAAMVIGTVSFLPQGTWKAYADTVSEEKGAFTVTAETQADLDAVTYEENILTFSSVAAGRSYVIRQTAGVNNATADRIVMQSGATTPVSITLEGVNINTASGPAMDIQGNSAVNLILADETVNTLITGCERVAGSKCRRRVPAPLLLRFQGMEKLMLQEVAVVQELAADCGRSVEM